jgi:hypothetical protein
MCPLAVTGISARFCGPAAKPWARVLRPRRLPCRLCASPAARCRLRRHLALTSVKPNTDQLEMTPWCRCSESFNVADKQPCRRRFIEHSSSKAATSDHPANSTGLVQRPAMGQALRRLDSRSNHCEGRKPELRTTNVCRCLCSRTGRHPDPSGAAACRSPTFPPPLWPEIVPANGYGNCRRRNRSRAPTR